MTLKAGVHREEHSFTLCRMYSYRDLQSDKASSYSCCITKLDSNIYLERSANSLRLVTCCPGNCRFSFYRRVLNLTFHGSSTRSASLEHFHLQDWMTFFTSTDRYDANLGESLQYDGLRKWEMTRGKSAFIYYCWANRFSEVPALGSRLHMFVRGCVVFQQSVISRLLDTSSLAKT